jgi:hypothetical protein
MRKKEGEDGENDYLHTGTGSKLSSMNLFACKSTATLPCYNKLSPLPSPKIGGICLDHIRRRLLNGFISIVGPTKWTFCCQFVTN